MFSCNVLVWCNNNNYGGHLKIVWFASHFLSDIIRLAFYKYMHACINKKTRSYLFEIKGGYKMFN